MRISSSLVSLALCLTLAAAAVIPPFDDSAVGRVLPRDVKDDESSPATTNGHLGEVDDGTHANSDLTHYHHLS